VDARQLLDRAREEPERIVVAQVVLDREGQAAQIVEVAQRVGVQPGGVEPLALPGHVRPGVGQRLAQPRELQRGELVARHRLLGRVQIAPRDGGEAGGFGRGAHVRFS
jgi:hypothetical protein